MLKAPRDPGPARFLMYVLWPAFLMSIVEVGILFSMFDPAEIDIAARDIAQSRQAAYAVGFFAFWALFSAGGALTYFLALGRSAPPPRVQQGTGRA